MSLPPDARQRGVSIYSLTAPLTIESNQYIQLTPCSTLAIARVSGGANADKLKRPSHLSLNPVVHILRTPYPLSQMRQ